MKPTEGRSVLWDNESGCDGTDITTPKHQRKGLRWQWGTEQLKGRGDRKT